MENTKVLNIIFLSIAAILLFCSLYPTCENMNSGEFECPPPGKGGIIDCNSIEIQDEQKRKMACDVLKQHCDVIAGSKLPDDIILPFDL